MKRLVTAIPFILFIVSSIFLGIFLRVRNISSYKFYPDSYQILLVAENIRNTGKVMGFLGDGGTFYPPYVTWTRSLTPMMTNVFVRFGLGLSEAAQFVSFIASIALFPVMFFFLKTLYKSSYIASCGLFLLAVSFCHTVWSGFIMTESLGILTLSLFSWSVLSSLHKPQGYINLADSVSGCLFALAVMTRYEYLVLIVPTVGILWKQKNSISRITTFLFSFFVVLAFWVSLLFSIPELIEGFMTEVTDLIAVFIALFLISLLGVYLYSKIKPWFTQKKAKMYLVLLLILWIFYAYILLQTIKPELFPFYFDEFSSLRTIFTHDFLLTFTGLLGLTFLLSCNTYRIYTLYIVSSVFLLGVVYFHTNFDMFRYFTHLIPFVIISSSYGLFKLLIFIRKSLLSPKIARNFGGGLVFISIAIGILAQTRISLNGIRYWRNGDWHELNYEDSVASTLKNKIALSNALLIVSKPEPYYLGTGLPTQTINDTPPFLHPNISLQNKEIFIIHDMGMQYLFPAFSHFVNSELREFKISEHWAHKSFQFGNQSFWETIPISLYRLPGEKLGQLLSI